MNWLKVADCLTCPNCSASLALVGDGSPQTGVSCSACEFASVAAGGQLVLREDKSADEDAYLEGARGTLRKSRWYPLVFRLLAPVLVSGPDPADRYGAMAQGGASVVDLGAGNDRRHPDFVNVDILEYPEVDIVSDGGGLPFADGSIDAVVCIVVLEHVPDARQVVEEVRRILRPGGRFFVAVPFLQPFHAAPHDYRRWTIPGLREELSNFEVVDEGVYGGPASTMAWLLAEVAALAFSFGSPKVRESLSLPLQAAFSPFKWLDVLLNRHPEADRLASAIWMEVERRPS